MAKGFIAFMISQNLTIQMDLLANIPRSILLHFRP